jgi:hypothetical protein
MGISLHAIRQLVLTMNKLFNNMQVINDQTMQNILHATQLDNRRSQGLAKSMKEDSIAMKTVCVIQGQLKAHGCLSELL